MSSPQIAGDGSSNPRVVKLEGMDQSPLLVMFGQLAARGLGEYVALPKFTTTGDGTSSGNLPDERIASCLADIMDEIRAEITKGVVELSSLGAERSTKAARQAYLVDVAQCFQNLIQCAVDGTWGGQHRTFFRDTSADQGNCRRLREVIQTLNRQFLDVMISKGCQWQVQEEQLPEPASNSEVSDEEVDTPISSTETNTDSYSNFDSFKHPQQLSKEAFVKRIYAVSQSDEENGVYTYHTVWDLFQDQSSGWSVLAEHHIETIRDAICTFLEDALETLTDSSSYNAILVDVVNPAMDKIEADALQMLDRILPSSTQIAPSWFKRKLVQSIEQAERQNKAKNIYQAMRHLSKYHQSADFDTRLSKVLLMANQANHQHDLGNISPEYIMSYLEVFYLDQLNSFLDRMTSMVVEACLIRNLVEIFPATSIPAIDYSSLERLAAETSESQARRAGLCQKLDCLKDSLAICEMNLIHAPRAKSRRSRNTAAQQKRTATTGVPDSSKDGGVSKVDTQHDIVDGEASGSMVPPQTPALTALIARFSPSTPRTDSYRMPGPSSQFSTESPVPKSIFTTPLVVDTFNTHNVVSTEKSHLPKPTSATPLTTPPEIGPFTDPPKIDKETVVGFDARRGYLIPTKEMKSATVTFGQTTPLTESPLSKHMNEASLQAASFIKRNYQIFGKALGADNSGLTAPAPDDRISIFANTPDRYPILEKSIASMPNGDGLGSPTLGRPLPTSATGFMPTALPQGDKMSVPSPQKQNVGDFSYGKSSSSADLSYVPSKTRTCVFDDLNPPNNVVLSSSPPLACRGEE